ncbi:FkbM family methyltransferase [Amycolatopsis minnesotensis]|uniref:FkbM family methyltransferase n=1 Tax=Amycolatopsis minnesotensis TaxID=337894 RepID=A0ABP5E3Q5_9PSEU
MAAQIRYVQLSDEFGCYVPANDSDDGSEIRFLHQEIFLDNCYLGAGVTLPSRPVVVDAGANVGLFSLAAKAARPLATVYALEPMPATFTALLANLAHYGHADVTALELALGAMKEDVATFTYYPGLPGNSTRHPESKARTRERYPAAARLLAGGRPVRVRVEPLSDVLDAVGCPRRIDLVKVDVEGAELDVLAGIRDRDWPRIRQLAVETDQLDAVRELLERKGFGTTVRVPDGPLREIGTGLVTARRA